MMREHCFKPSGKLTFDTVCQYSQRMLLLLQNNAINMIRLDLCDVKQCDSAGLSFLIDTKRLCKTYQKQLLIEGIPQAVSALAEFCGLGAVLK